MQSARNLVGILVEFPAGMQYTHDNFGCRSFGLMFVIQLDADRNPAPIIRHRNRIIGMNGDHNIVTMAGKRLVNRVIDNFENHMMETGTIRSITNVHSRAFANSFQSFQLLNARLIVSIRVIHFSHSLSNICFT